jgi:hypothetical protein
VSDLVPASALPAAAALVVVSLGVAAVYLFVGFRLYQRPVAASARLASAQLSVWWSGLGATTALGGVELALAAVGALPYPLALTCYLLTILLDCALLWGLVGFLIYVYTGQYRLVWLTAFYAWFYGTVLYYIFNQQPFSVAIVAGQATIQYLAKPIPAIEAVIIVGLFGPEIVGAILYLSLLRRTRDPPQRYRITLVGGGIMLWLLLDLFVPTPTVTWSIVRGVLQVVPGVMSLIAFYPPEWARRRYGVTAMAGPDSPTPEGVPDR